MEIYHQLIRKLDQFIKKYYKINLIRGLILSIGILTSLYLIITFSEFYFFLSTTGRAIFLFGYTAVFLVIFYVYIIRPLLRLFKIGHLISYEQASEIITKHFTDIKDKLINILQLKQLSEESAKDQKLIFAAIIQKIEEIKVFKFNHAIQYSQLKKYLKYGIPPVLIFIAILLVSPGMIQESTNRIIHFGHYYEKPKPFQFILLNKDLAIEKGDNKKIELKVIGSYIPEDVFIQSGGNEMIMKRKEGKSNEFFYEFKNIYNSFEFRFISQGINSESFQIEVLPTPTLINFITMVDAPDYTHEPDTIYFNNNDIVVPFGSKVKYIFKSTDADSLIIENDKKALGFSISNNESYYKFFAIKNIDFAVKMKNPLLISDTLVQLSLFVIPDLYPSIIVEQQKDTANLFISYFHGLITDDYGFQKLEFKYRVIEKDATQNGESFSTEALSISKTNLKQEFYHAYDFSKIDLKESEVIEYFFEIGDNDGINGSKVSRSEIMIFEVPTYKEKKEFENTVNEELEKKLDKSIRITEELQRDIQLFKERNIEGNSNEWENKQLLQNIFDKQNLLKQLTEEISRENKEKNKTLDQFNEKTEEILQKQEDIEKLLEELMTDELKELMKQIEELQKQFDQQMMEKILEEQEFSYEELSERLDRTKELLKREQVEQKIEDAVNELNKLSEEQKQLSEEINEKNHDFNQLIEEQKEIEERFDEIMKDYEKALELNKELKNEMNLENFEQEKNEISEEFNNTDEQMQKGKKTKASDSQSKNSQNMKSLSEKMKSGLEMNGMQQEGENIETLRKILENLIEFSFLQEKLLVEIKETPSNHPKFVEIYERQLHLGDDFKIIEDSLKTLAARLPLINKRILDEIFEINSNIRESGSFLKERNIKKTMSSQVNIMTSSNNLALLLSEILKQMKEQMQSGGSGGGSSKSKKQNGKQEAFDGLKSGQERLKKQMEEMLEQMKNGEGQFNENSQNKKLAKMLAEQEIMRQMLKEMNSNFSLSPETQKLLREIEKMTEENEKEIVNKRITPEILERQKQIETRLLEAEKSENKRKTENKRESEEGKNSIYKSPKDIFKNKNEKNSFNENLYKQNIQMHLFYKNLYEKYSKETTQ